MYLLKVAETAKIYILVGSHKWTQSISSRLHGVFWAKVSSTRSSCRVMVVCLLNLQMKKKDGWGFA